MGIQEYIFGVDLDNTLTNVQPYKVDGMDLEKTRKIIRNAPPKKGIEILKITGAQVIVITGRGDYFHDDSLYWLEKNDIEIIKLVTIDGNKYTNHKFSLDEYLKYKLDTYLSNKIHFCLEDDDNVISMLNKYDIKTSKVEDDFEKAFFNLFK